MQSWFSTPRFTRKGGIERISSGTCQSSSWDKNWYRVTFDIGVQRVNIEYSSVLRCLASLFIYLLFIYLFICLWAVEDTPYNTQRLIEKVISVSRVWRRSWSGRNKRLEFRSLTFIQYRCFAPNAISIGRSTQRTVQRLGEKNIGRLNSWTRLPRLRSVSIGESVTVWRFDFNRVLSRTCLISLYPILTNSSTRLDSPPRLVPQVCFVHPVTSSLSFTNEWINKSLDAATMT